MAKIKNLLFQIADLNNIINNTNDGEQKKRLMKIRADLITDLETKVGTQHGESSAEPRTS